jgi:HAD superfamily hydrolase (TIGR01509 family)
LRIKALIFDVDGTLADTEEAHLDAFNRAFAREGLAWHWSPLDYAGHLKVTGGKERMAAFVASLPLDASQRRVLTERIPDIHRTKTEIYTRSVADGRVPLRQGVEQLIREAESAGVVLAIASTTTRENIDALLSASLGPWALDYFSVIGAADQARQKKPAPDIYRFVLAELGESAADCVALEDSANGLAAAKGAGLFTVVTPSQWTRGEDFAAADLLLSSLASCDSPLMELEYAFTAARSRGWRSNSAAAGDA